MVFGSLPGGLQSAEIKDANDRHDINRLHRLYGSEENGYLLFEELEALLHFISLDTEEVNTFR